jgi:hypothetical protein
LGQKRQKQKSKERTQEFQRKKEIFSRLDNVLTWPFAIMFTDPRGPPCSD